MSVYFVNNFDCLCLFIFLLLVGGMNHQIWCFKSLRLCSLQVIVISLVAPLERKSIKTSKTFIESQHQAFENRSQHLKLFIESSHPAFVPVSGPAKFFLRFLRCFVASTSCFSWSPLLTDLINLPVLLVATFDNRYNAEKSKHKSLKQCKI